MYCPGSGVGSARQVAEDLPDQAGDDHQDDDAGEQVGGHRERPAGLADAAQVAVAHQDHDRDRDDGDQVRVVEHGDGGGHRRRARGHLDRHRDHVVDEQRDRGDLGHPGPEVVPGDHVRSAGPGVDRDDLAVGQHHQRHHEQDHPGQRQDQGERGDRQAALEQLDQDLLGAVRRGGDPVRGQDAERGHVGQPLLAEFLVDHGRAEQPPFQRVPDAFRQVVAPAEEAHCLAHRQLRCPSLA